MTNILNIKINTENKKTILQKVESLLLDNQQHYIVTPNPEIVLFSVNDTQYRDVLNKADLQLPDGVGLKFASWLTDNKIQERIKGSDFVYDLCFLAEQKKYSVFLLGGQDDVAEKASVVLQKKYPALKIVGADNGGIINEEGVLIDEKVLDKINSVKPEILFVAFGFPKQERFIANYLDKIPSVKLAIGVGGSFDFISGNIKRAPKFLQAVGLEWLWRLVLQPSRIKRIYNAVIKFPYLFLKWKILVKPVYRQNVMLFIMNDKNQVLIVKRKPRSHDVQLLGKNSEKILNDHWQLPQGGTDGQSLEIAARREAGEEVGIENLEILGFSKKSKKYDTPLGHQFLHRRFGQEQKVAYLKFTGQENEIKCDNRECDDHRWVNIDELINSVHNVRKERIEFALESIKDLKN